MNLIHLVDNGEDRKDQCCRSEQINKGTLLDDLLDDVRPIDRICLFLTKFIISQFIVHVGCLMFTFHFNFGGCMAFVLAVLVLFMKFKVRYYA